MLKSLFINFFVLVILLTFLPVKSFTQTNNGQFYYDVTRFSQSNSKGNNPDRKKGNKWYYRWLWNNRFDIQPDGKLKPLPYFMGYSQNQKNSSNSLQSKSDWIPLGPDKEVPTYEPRSCHGIGRVNCLAFHPTNPDILWIGTPGGGVWKSENSGKSWTPLTDNLPTLSVSHISVDPNNPDIIYVCTGDFDTGGISSSESMGVYKSTDGGISWNLTNLYALPSFQYSSLRTLIINPQNSNQLLTAGGMGIWKSDDAGANWYFILDSLIYDIDSNPSNPNILYAAMGSKWQYDGSQWIERGSAGVLKSTDFGTTWTTLNTGIPPKNVISRMDIAVSPADPNYIYEINVNPQSNGMHSIYGSRNAGETWEKICDNYSAPNVLGGYEGASDDQGGQGWYDLTLLADPLNKDKFYTGGTNIWMTEDGGKTFGIVSLWMNVFGKSIHADHHYSAYNPLNKYFYYCNDGGVFRTKSIQPGSAEWIALYIDKVAENLKPGAPDTLKFPTVWENLSDGLNITEFYRLNVSTKSTGIVTGGSQDNSCFYNDGKQWINYIANWDGMETMIDHNNPEIIYGVWQGGGLCRSDDGGKTIIRYLADTIRNVAGEQGGWVTPCAMDPITPSTIYMGFRNLWQSKDYGNHWAKILDFDSKQFDTLNLNSLSIIRTSYSNSGYIAVYKSNYYGIAPGELWLTKNNGVSWIKSTTNLPLDNMDISSIEFDNTNPNKIWLSIYTTSPVNNLFVSEDFGQSWENVSKSLPAGVAILSIVRDQNSDNNTIYAGTNKGVLYTNDNSSEWLQYMENLPNAKVNELEIHQQTGELYAATYGRGIWKTSTISEVKENKLNSSVDIAIYPNPVKNRLNLQITENNEIQNLIANISVVDITGRTVFSNNAQLLTNNSEIGFDIDFLPGIYFLEVKAKDLDIVKKFVVK